MYTCRLGKYTEFIWTEKVYGARYKVVACVTVHSAGPSVPHTSLQRREQLVVNDERRLPAGRVLIQGVVLRTHRTT